MWLWLLLLAAGWSYKDVLPYFKKSEDIRIVEYNDSGYRGHGGYLTVERINYESSVVNNVLEAFSQMNYSRTDINGAAQVGYDRTQGTLRDGLRCSTAKAFLRPAKDRANLHISLYSHVTRVLIHPTTKHAQAVQFYKTNPAPSSPSSNHPLTIYATKEVIICAGAIQSPQILMLSGIGPSDHLIQKGIHPIVDSPGVGKNLQDHIAMGGLTFLIDSPASTLPMGAGFVLPRALTMTSVIQFENEKKGPMYDIPFCELMGFVNTRYNNNSAWPDIQFIVGTAGDNDDGGLFFRKDTGLTDEAFFKVYGANMFQDAITIAPLLLRPESSGNITLRDSNPFSPPIINANYFDAPKDIKVLREGAKIAYEIGTAPAMKKLNSRFNGVPFPGCDQFELLSDEFWECQGRQYTMTIYHPCGTCKMGPGWDTEAVVDTNLIVKGIDNLRVIDASIMPRIPTGNTNAPTIMIAEKGSDLIKAKWINYLPLPPLP